MSKRTGGPAFPGKGLIDDPMHRYPVLKDFPGMSLRDWFAGQALAGLLAGSDMEASPSIQHGETIEAALARRRKTEAEWCFAMADAMLKAGAAQMEEGA